MCGRILKKKYKVNSQPTSSSWLVKGVRSRTQRGVAWVWVMVHDALLRKKTVQSRIQGRGPGGPGLPLFLDQNEAPRTEKKLFWGRPPTPYLRVWMTPPPPPPPLSGGLNPPLRYWHGVEITEVRNWQDCREKGQWCGIWTPLLDFVRFSKSLPHNYW